VDYQTTKSGLSLLTHACHPGYKVNQNIHSLTETIYIAAVLLPFHKIHNCNHCDYHILGTAEVCYTSTSASIYMLKLPVRVVIQAGMNPLLGMLLEILPEKLLGILPGILQETARTPAIKNEYYIPKCPNNTPTWKQPSCGLLMHFTAIVMCVDLCSILENNSHCNSVDMPMGVVASPSEFYCLDVIPQLPLADPTQYMVARNYSHITVQTYT